MRKIFHDFLLLKSTENFGCVERDLNSHLRDTVPPFYLLSSTSLRNHEIFSSCFSGRFCNTIETLIKQFIIFHCRSFTRDDFTLVTLTYLVNLSFVSNEIVTITSCVNNKLQIFYHMSLKDTFYGLNNLKKSVLLNKFVNNSFSEV